MKANIFEKISSLQNSIRWKHTAQLNALVHPATFFPSFSQLETRSLPRRLGISAWQTRGIGDPSPMDTFFTSLLCCIGTRRRQGQLQQRSDGRSDEDHAKTSCLRATRQSVGARFTRAARVEHLETSGPRRRRRWPRLRGMNRVLARSFPPHGMATAGTVEPRPTTTTDGTATAVQAEEELSDRAGGHGFSSSDHGAVATIQAHFRGHLVRTLLCGSVLESFPLSSRTHGSTEPSLSV
jgi:hypothetical protein